MMSWFRCCSGFGRNLLHSGQKANKYLAAEMPKRKVHKDFESAKGMERWAGRVALVTGASSGIGAAICKQLVAAGMKVVGTDLAEDKIQDLAKKLSDQPGLLTGIRCDLTKDAEVLSLFSSIKEQFGGVDVCVNNAGVVHKHSLLDGTPEEWREILDVNVVALCLCTREAVVSMMDRKVDDGQIIHIGSMLGHRITPSGSTHCYAASKFAVKALVEGLRQELRAANSHIRVSAVSPGIVDTDFIPRLGEEGEQIIKSLQCLQPDDVASTVLHVLSVPPHVQIHDILVRPTEEEA